MQGTEMSVDFSIDLYKDRFRIVAMLFQSYFSSTWVIGAIMIKLRGWIGEGTEKETYRHNQKNPPVLVELEQR